MGIITSLRCGVCKIFESQVERTFLAKCNYDVIMPEVRHRPVIPHTVFKYNYLSIKVKNVCYLSLSQLLILLPLII